MRYFAFLIVLASLAFAPAPLPSRLKPVEQLPYPVPGRYLMSWGPSTDGECELTSMTTGWYMYYNLKFYFLWEFDNHVFTMWELSERSNGKRAMLDQNYRNMNRYQFVLNDDLRTTWQPNSLRLELKRRR